MVPPQGYSSGVDFQFTANPPQTKVEDVKVSPTSNRVYPRTVQSQLASPGTKNWTRKNDRASDLSRDPLQDFSLNHAYSSGSISNQVVLPPIRDLFTDLIPGGADTESFPVNPFRSVTNTPSSSITAQPSGLPSYTHSPFKSPTSGSASASAFDTPVVTRDDESYLSLRDTEQLKGRPPVVCIAGTAGLGSSGLINSPQLQTPNNNHRLPSLASIVREPNGSSSSTEDESDTSSCNSVGGNGSDSKVIGGYRKRSSLSDRRTSEHRRYLDIELSTPQSNVLYRSESPRTSVSGYSRSKVSTGKTFSSPHFSVLSSRDFTAVNGGCSGDLQGDPHFGAISPSKGATTFNKRIGMPLVSPICIGMGKSRGGKGNSLKRVDSGSLGGSGSGDGRRGKVGKVPDKPQIAVNGGPMSNGRAGLKCLHCGEVDTPEWRRGPYGSRTLCNACGLYYRKLIKKFNPKNANLIMRYNRMVYPLDRRIPVSASVPQHVIDQLNNDVTLDSDYYSVGGMAA